MDAEYLYPTTQGRIRELVFWSLVVLFVAFQGHILSPLLDPIIANDSPDCGARGDPCAVLTEMRILTLYFTLLPIIVSALVARRAHRIFHSHMSPPPEDHVLFKTKVSRGFVARLHGYLFFGIALLLAAAPGYAWYKTQAVALFCFPEACGCS